MSTLPLTGRGSPGDAGVRAPPRATPHAPAVLAAALLLVVLYAAFSHGGAALSTSARIQVALAAMTAGAGAAWLWTGGLRLATPRLAIAGVVLLAMFATWSGITVFWSVAPEQTWIALNRAISYVIVLCLAIGLGASDPRARAGMRTG